jgi:hypothetical protein
MFLGDGPLLDEVILRRESGDGGETMGPEVRQIRGRQVSPSAWARSPLRHDRCSWCCVQNKNKNKDSICRNPYAAVQAQ